VDLLAWRVHPATQSSRTASLLNILEFWKQRGMNDSRKHKAAGAYSVRSGKVLSDITGCPGLYNPPLILTHRVQEVSIWLPLVLLAQTLRLYELRTAYLAFPTDSTVLKTWRWPDRKGNSMFTETRHACKARVHVMTDVVSDARDQRKHVLTLLCTYSWSCQSWDASGLFSISHNIASNPAVIKTHNYLADVLSPQFVTFIAILTL
jgi:hypothetical protein